MITTDALDELLTVASAGLMSAQASEAFHARTGGATAQEQGKRASEALLKVCSGLEGLGAQDRAPLVKPTPTNPLAELARVESSRSEALALLDALRHALSLAEALDAKRGDVLAAPVGGSAGLVWGDRLVQAVCGLELELFGPSKAVTKGRE